MAPLGSTPVMVIKARPRQPEDSMDLRGLHTAVSLVVRGNNTQVKVDLDHLTPVKVVVFRDLVTLANKAVIRTINNLHLGLK